MNWYTSALLGALIWGVHYPLVDKALDKISLTTVLLLTTIPMIISAPFFYKNLVQDLGVFVKLDMLDRIQILSIMVTSISATVFVFMAISAKNATLASLIEISYPVFVALFSMLILRENHITPVIATGAFLIFAGVGLIIYKQ